MKRFFGAAAAVGLAAFTMPAAAITWGAPDGDDHPNVVALLFVQNGVGFFSCSGTLSGGAGRNRGAGRGIGGRRAVRRGLWAAGFAGPGRSTAGSRSPSARLREHGSAWTGGLNFLSAAKAEAASLLEALKRTTIDAGFVSVSEDNFVDIRVRLPMPEGITQVESTRKRHELEDALDQELGWYGLGYCDGGETSAASIELLCRVIDVEIASRTILTNLHAAGHRAAIVLAS